MQREIYPIPPGAGGFFCRVPGSARGHQWCSHRAAYRVATTNANGTTITSYRCAAHAAEFAERYGLEMPEREEASHG